ncbi:unnamed protein product [Phaeothamnion confervicola]
MAATGDGLREAPRIDLKEIAKDAIASIFGSAACVYVGQPLDTIKVRMQARPDAFSGPWQCLRKTLAEEPVSALWKGSTPALSGAIMENIVAFGVNQQLKRVFPEEEGRAHPWWQPIVCGGTTGIFTSAVLCPNDVVKCKVQVGRSLKQQASRAPAAASTLPAMVGGSSGVAGVAASTATARAAAAAAASLPAMNASQMTRHILRTQGPRGFFVGLGAQFARDIPFYAAFFGTYDLTRSAAQRHDLGVPDEVQFFLAGGMAGVGGWVVCMPIDVAKSIIQTSEKPMGLIPTMRHVVRTQGATRLFSGLSAALIRAFPANAALFVVYELVRRNLEHH